MSSPERTPVGSPQEDLAVRLQRQAETCAGYGSALYGELLSGAAEDYRAGGPTAEVLAGAERDPAGSVPALRLAGALHRLVLERRAPVLATHYPSVGGTAGPSGVWTVARQVLAEQPDAVRAGLARPVQTNEPGRQSVLFGVLAWATARHGLPVRLLEVGASAGLNLRPERSRYIVDGHARGGLGPLLLDEPWEPGPRPPDVEVRVLSRAGCDPAPVDPTTTDGRLTLTSYVWADMVGRLERLRHALALAAEESVVVSAEAGSAFLARELVAPAPGVVTVVWHSVVRQYMTQAERDEVGRLLDGALGRATADAPVVHASMEWERRGDDGFDVRARTHGQHLLLARCHGHGPPVTWLPVVAD